MKILKFTEQNIEPTNEEVTESKLIDKKFISDNPKRVFVEINTEYGFEFKSNLEELKDLVNEILSCLDKDEKDYIINSINGK
jgi:uncharacterized protein YeeX (DUF496 family)